MMGRSTTKSKLEDVNSEAYSKTFQKLQNIIRAEQERLMNDSTKNGEEEKLHVRHIVSCSGVLIQDDGEMYTTTEITLKNGHVDILKDVRVSVMTCPDQLSLDNTDQFQIDTMRPDQIVKIPLRFRRVRGSCKETSPDSLDTEIAVTFKRRRTVRCVLHKIRLPFYSSATLTTPSKEAKYVVVFECVRVCSSAREFRGDRFTYMD